MIKKSTLTPVIRLGNPEEEMNTIARYFVVVATIFSFFAIQGCGNSANTEYAPVVSADTTYKIFSSDFVVKDWPGNFNKNHVVKDWQGNVYPQTWTYEIPLMVIYPSGGYSTSTVKGYIDDQNRLHFNYPTFVYDDTAFPENKIQKIFFYLVDKDGNIFHLTLRVDLDQVVGASTGSYPLEYTYQAGVEFIFPDKREA